MGRVKLLAVLYRCWKSERSGIPSRAGLDLGVREPIIYVPYPGRSNAHNVDSDICGNSRTSGKVVSTKLLVTCIVEHAE